MSKQKKELMSDMVEPTYNTIGKGYTKYRQADIRIVDLLYSLLNLPSGSVVADIGAGAGSYSLALAHKDYKLKAIEPSAVMRMQSRETEKVEWITGTAENVPLENDSVNGVVVVLVLHHFTSLQDAANEMYRICPSGPVVIFSFDPRESAKLWFSNYFPEIWQQTYEVFPPIDTVAQNIASGKDWSIEKVNFPLSYDLTDKFMGAGWRTPEIYLDPLIRQIMSGFTLADTEVVRRGIKCLRNDLKSGEWDNNYGHNRQRCSFDAGYRLLRFISNKNKGE